jgi:hypothetical protein
VPLCHELRQAAGTKGAQTVCMSYHVGAKEQY